MKVMFGFWKCWGKVQEKENKEKKWKKKNRKKIKIDSKLINCFYIFFKIYFTHFLSWYKDYIILKCINF